MAAGDVIFTAAVETAGAEASLQNFATKATQTGQQADGFFGGLVGGAAKLGLAVSGVSILAQGIGGLASDMIAGNATMEDYGTQFEVLTGSAENAANMMNNLKVMAAKTPFEFTDLAKGTQTLLAFGVAQKDIIPDLQMLGDISGGNVNKLNSLSLVFGQVASQGKMMGGDLLQMINAGFNPLKVISDKTGQSMGELRSEMSKGKITYDMVKDAMETATSTGGQFAGMMDKQSQTFDGLTSTMSDDINSLKRTAMQPIFEGIKAGLEQVLPMLESDTFQNAASNFATGVASAIPVAISVLSTLFQILSFGWNIIQPFVATAIQLATGFVQIATGAQSLNSPLGAMLGPLGGVADAFSAIHDGIVEVVAGFTAGGLQGAFAALVANIPTFLSGLQQIGFGIANQAVQWAMKLVDWVGPAIPGIVSAIASFFGAMFQWIVSTGIPQAISFLTQLGDTLINWIGPKIPGMVAQLQAWGTALLGWILNTAIPGLFTALVGAGEALVNWIGPKIPDLLAGLASFGASMFNWLTLTALPMIVTKLVEWANAFISWIGPQIPVLITKLVEFGGALFNWLLTTGLPTLIQKLTEWANAMIAWIGPLIPPLLANLGNLLQQFGGWMISTALPAIVQKLGEWANAFIAWVGPQIPILLGKFAEFLTALLVWTINVALPAIVSKMLEWGGAIIKWVLDALPGLANNLNQLLVQFANWAGDAVPKVLNWMVQVGGAIIDGIIRGLGQSPDAIKNFILDMAKGAVDAIKNFFGISSPSSLMVEQWSNVGKGMLVGLQGTTPAVLDHLTGVLNTISNQHLPTFEKAIKTMTSPMAGAQTATATASAGSTYSVADRTSKGTGAVYNIYITQDPYGNYQLDKLAEELLINVYNRTGHGL